MSVSITTYGIGQKGEHHICRLTIYQAIIWSDDYSTCIYTVWLNFGLHTITAFDPLWKFLTSWRFSSDLLSSVTRVIVCGKDAVMVVALLRIVTVAVLTAAPHGILSTASLPRMVEAASQFAFSPVVSLDAARRSIMCTVGCNAVRKDCTAGRGDSSTTPHAAKYWALS